MTVRSLPVARLLAMVLVAKLLLLAFGWVAFETLTNQPVWADGGPLAIWNRWDALHYLWLAEHGYTAVGEKHLLIAFLPGLPALIRVASWLTGGQFAAAGLLVSSASACAAVLLLWRLVALDRCASEAWRAVLLLLAFPSAYFLQAVYTEAPFLALVLGAFLGARQRRWAVSGLCAGLATLTRVNGWLLLPALAIEAWDEARETRRINAAWLWLALVPLALGLYLLLNQHLFGEPFTFLRVQREHWYRQFDWPWNGLRSTLGQLVQRQPAEAHMLGTQEFLFALLTLLATLGTLRVERPSYALWIGANWLIAVGQAFVYCIPRFCLTWFPLFLMAARVTRRPAVLWATLAWGLLFQALFAALFVQGQWAF